MIKVARDTIASVDDGDENLQESERWKVCQNLRILIAVRMGLLVVLVVGGRFGEHE